MRVLIVDDDRLTRRMLTILMGKLGYEVLEAKDGAEALKIVSEHRIRFVITDWMMPRLNGLELVRALRLLSTGHLIYVILLTAKEDKAELVEAMNAGADDFIRKPFDRDELRVRVRAGQRIIDLTERLERQAMTDPLTGLLNRRGLHESLASRNPDRDCLGSQGMGFVVADLDHFKRVNDSFGHAVGDLFLQQVARILCDVFEPRGIVARMGGEEFWALLCDCEATELAQYTERARHRIASHPFQLPSDSAASAATVALTASFGYCHTPALGNRRLENLFQIADGALYQAKASGRNRVMAA